jgi:parallel beta-helix repeat protein
MSAAARLAAATAATMALLTAISAPAAFAGPPETVACGQTLTHSVRLAADLTDCPGDGLVIGADAITVDLDGHTIDGVAAAGCDFPAEFRVGIANPGFDRVTIRNGTVRQFDTGVDAGGDTDGMRDGRVHGLTVLDNRFGGVNIGSSRREDTARNRIDHNVVTGTRCGSGLEVNTGVANSFAANRVTDSATGIVVCCGEATDANAVEDNVVARTTENGVLVFESGATRIAGNALSDIGGDGIAIIGGHSSDAVIDGNTIARAQFGGVVVFSCCDPQQPGIPTGVRITGNTLRATADGILLFEADGATISRNTLTGVGTFGDPTAAAFGIVLDGASDAAVTRNTVTGGRGPGITVGVTPEFEPSARPTADNVIARNTVSEQGADGIVVNAVARGTTVERNTANRNGADGIRVLSPFTTLVRNIADDNGAFGIEAVPGVTDGGGNEASGNGAPAQGAGVAGS